VTWWQQGLKIGLAGAIAFVIVSVLRLPAPFWGPLSAMAVVQGQIGTSLTASRNYIIANVVGTLAGTLAVTTFGSSVAVTSLAVVGITVLCGALGLLTTAPIAAAIPIVLVTLVTGDPWVYGAWRLFDIMLGLAIGIGVSLLLWPVRGVEVVCSNLATAIRGCGRRAGLALESVGTGGSISPDAIQISREIRSCLFAAQAALASAASEPDRSPRRRTALPFFVADVERMMEHTDSIVDVARARPPGTAPDQVKAVAAVAPAVESACLGLAAVVEARDPAPLLPLARAPIDQLASAVTDASTTAAGGGAAAPAIYEVVNALQGFSRECERLYLRVQQPDRLPEPAELAHLPAPARPAFGLSRLWRRDRSG
jgi:uncharacterized membrane protein YccC